VGAGASYGAGPVDPEPPPLGDKLLGQLRRACPDTWGQLLDNDEIATFEGASTGPQFEDGMRLLWQRRDRRIEPLLVDLALYFAKFRPTGRPNCYCRLAGTLYRFGVGFVVCSLNYDCIFELTLAANGLRVQHFGSDQVPSDGTITFVKPHGSCNYLAPGTRDVKDSHLGGWAMVESATDDPLAFEVVDPVTLEELYRGQKLSTPPVISLYERDKFSPVIPKTVAMLREWWCEKALEADIILTIGVRPVLQDEHVWGPIIASSAEVWFVGDGEDQLRSEIPSRLDVVGPYFSDAIPLLKQRLHDATRA
jgi:hypothetical protein